MYNLVCIVKLSNQRVGEAVAPLKRYRKLRLRLLEQNNATNPTKICRLDGALRPEGSKE